jgi:hypothetical protein
VTSSKTRTQTKVAAQASSGQSTPEHAWTVTDFEVGRPLYVLRCIPSFLPFAHPKLLILNRSFHSKEGRANSVRNPQAELQQSRLWLILLFLVAQVKCTWPGRRSPASWWPSRCSPSVRSNCPTTRSKCEERLRSNLTYGTATPSRISTLPAARPHSPQTLYRHPNILRCGV